MMWELKKYSYVIFYIIELYIFILFIFFKRMYFYLTFLQTWYILLRKERGIAAMFDAHTNFNMLSMINALRNIGADDIILNHPAFNSALNKLYLEVTSATFLTLSSFADEEIRATKRISVARRDNSSAKTLTAEDGLIILETRHTNISEASQNAFEWRCSVDASGNLVIETIKCSSEFGTEANTKVEESSILYDVSVQEKITKQEERRITVSVPLFADISEYRSAISNMVKD